jgi:hypothetical protein
MGQKNVKFFAKKVSHVVMVEDEGVMTVLAFRNEGCQRREKLDCFGPAEIIKSGSQGLINSIDRIKISTADPPGAV